MVAGLSVAVAVLLEPSISQGKLRTVSKKLALTTTKIGKMLNTNSGHTKDGNKQKINN